MSQMHTVGSHKTTVRTGEGRVSVVYHSTEVFAYDRATRVVTLNSGGWRTSTTKTRINQAAAQFGVPVQVFAKKGEWFAQTPAGVVPFEDRMTVEVQ